MGQSCSSFHTKQSVYLGDCKAAVCNAKAVNIFQTIARVRDHLVQQLCLPWSVLTRYCTRQAKHNFKVGTMLVIHLLQNVTLGYPRNSISTCHKGIEPHPPLTSVISISQPKLVGELKYWVALYSMQPICTEFNQAAASDLRCGPGVVVQTRAANTRNKNKSPIKLARQRGDPVAIKRIHLLKLTQWASATNFLFG